MKATAPLVVHAILVRRCSENPGDGDVTLKIRLSNRSRKARGKAKRQCKGKERDIVKGELKPAKPKD